jgi:hypothetical protein
MTRSSSMVLRTHTYPSLPDAIVQSPLSSVFHSPVGGVGGGIVGGSVGGGIVGGGIVGGGVVVVGGVVPGGCGLPPVSTGSDEPHPATTAMVPAMSDGSIRDQRRASDFIRATLPRALQCRKRQLPTKIGEIDTSDGYPRTGRAFFR